MQTISNDNELVSQLNYRPASKLLYQMTLGYDISTLWTIWIIAVLTALLIPQTQAHVITALQAMSDAPDWFQILVLTSAAASFGVRDIIKNRLARPKK